MLWLAGIPPFREMEPLIPSLSSFLMTMFMIPEDYEIVSMDEFIEKMNSEE